MFLLFFFISIGFSSGAQACPITLFKQSCEIQEKACRAAATKDPEMADARNHMRHCSLMGDGLIQELSGVNGEFLVGFSEGAGLGLYEVFFKPHIDAIKTVNEQRKILTPLINNCYSNPKCRKLLPQIFLTAAADTAMVPGDAIVKAAAKFGDKKYRDACAQLIDRIPDMALHWAGKKFKNFECYDAFTRGKKTGELFAFANPEEIVTNVSKGALIAVVKNQTSVTADEIAERETVKIGAGAATQAAAPAEKIRVRRSRAADIPSDAREPLRELFVRQESNLLLTTPEENRAFIAEARNTSDTGDRVFVGTEAAELKRINDLMQDKRFSDSVVNRYKRTLLKNLKETHDLEKEFPGLKIYASYSDYKGLQILLKGKIPPELGEKLDKIYHHSNADFVKYLRDNHLIREGDDTSTWFRMAYGTTFDSQALASRMSRKMPGPPQVASFSDPKVLAFATGQLKNTQAMQKALVADKSLAPLMESSPIGPALQKKVYDLAKKAKTADRLAPLLEQRYGHPVTQAQAQKILDYMKGIDDFPAPLLIEKREIVNLDKANHGGFTIDLLGVGSRNIQVTAEAVAKSKNISEAAINSRAAEIKATEAIQDQLARIRHIAGDIAKTSGDDSAGAFKKPWSKTEKQELLNRLAADPVAKDVRMAFIPEGVTNVADRTMISTHGEKIEAFMRLNLEEKGIIAPNRLDELTFAIDMNAKQVGKGTADVMMASHGPPLTAAEKTKIRQALSEAVEQNNQLLRSEGNVANYVATP